MTWKGIVGLSFSGTDFEKYCQGLSWASWRPQFVVLHNTAVPTLAQRPKGLTRDNILALESFYRDQQHWEAGPHLFVDDAQIWVFTPLTTSGTHSPSWNKVSFGIEMLGDYASEAFATGRGSRVRDNAVSAIASLSAAVGIDPGTMRLHKEDPLTTHACPGANVDKQDIIARSSSLLAQRHPGDHLVPA